MLASTHSDRLLPPIDSTGEPGPGAGATLEPREFAERILREHDARVAAARPWHWGDDPTWASVVVLAVETTRQNPSPRDFQAKLERLGQVPTGAAGQGAALLRARWRAEGEWA